VILRAAACAALILLSGCAALPDSAPAGGWESAKLQLQALDRWTLDGRVAVAASGEGFSGGLSWEQAGPRAEVELRGPVGGRVLAIRVDGDEFSVTDPDGETYDGERAQALVADRLGSGLPIAELRYWLVGVPAPGAPFEETLGADARLAALDQAGWHIRYDRYRSAGAFVRPAKLDITQGALRLRVSVSDWRLAP
jgi:outer membrane lipoprotein LolB